MDPRDYLKAKMTCSPINSMLCMTSRVRQVVGVEQAEHHGGYLLDLAANTPTGYKSSDVEAGEVVEGLPTHD